MTYFAIAHTYGDDSDVSYFRRADGIVQQADLSDPRLSDWL